MISFPRLVRYQYKWFIEMGFFGKTVRFSSYIIKYRLIGMVGFICLCFFMLIFSVRGADFQFDNIQSMKEVQKYVDKFLQEHKPEKILVCFDLDFTIWMGKHPATQLANIKRYGNSFRRIMGEKDQLVGVIALNLAGQYGETKLVEDVTPHIIHNIQDTGVKTIALTAALSGRIGNIRRHEVWRAYQLRKFGIDFQSSFPDVREKYFLSLDRYNDNYSVFYEGILCANGEQHHISKGEVLVHFLHDIKYQPHVIICVDDRPQALESVRKALQLHKPNIQFVGLNYRRAYKLNSPAISHESFQQFWEKLVMLARRGLKTDHQEVQFVSASLHSQNKSPFKRFKRLALRKSTMG